MSTYPLVSVVMPVYNSSRFLPEAIESVLGQTYPHFEFIIVDDASTDDSWNIIQRYASRDHRIKTIRNADNLKICKALNKGINLAKGKYIARFDSDDICLPERLRAQVDFMELPENSKVGVCGSNVLLIDEHGEVTGEKDFPESDFLCREKIWFYNPFCHSSVLVRKVCFESVGVYNDYYLYAEDLELWFRLGAQFQFHNLPECLLKYRIHHHNSTFVDTRPMIESALKIRRIATEKYGYKMGANAKIFYFLTKSMIGLPSVLIFKLFKILRKVA